MPIQPEKFLASLTTLTITADSHKLELAAEVLASGHSLRLRAFGTSMLPSIWPGYLLTIEPAPEQEIATGDIVLVVRQNRFLIHRLIDKQESCWITRGDSLPQNDDPFAPCEVLGRVSLIHKNKKTIVPEPRRSLFNRTLAWMLCRSDTLRTVALRVHSLSHSCSASTPSTGSGQALLAGARASCPRP